MGLDDRKLDVLRAIVEDYVATQEPVGSKALVERHNLRVSAATVRNDMAVLEDEGYLRQPHTSAGRVPTDRGYRLFVDKLSRIKPLSVAERRAIERFMAGAVDLDDVVHRTVRLLAQVTGQVAVVQYPSLSRSSVRHLELLAVSTTRLMLVMITDTGRVEQRIVELPAPTSIADVSALRTLINEKLDGRRLLDAPPLVQALVDEVDPTMRRTMSALAAVLLETLFERTDERLALAGASSLTRAGIFDFHGSIRPILEALEEEVVLLKLIGTAEGGGATSADRRRERDRAPAYDVRRLDRLRARIHNRRRHGRDRADPDGLSGNDHRGSGRGTLRRRVARPELNS